MAEIYAVLCCISALPIDGWQADAAVFADKLNGLPLPDRGVMKAFFLSGAEIIPLGVAGGGGGDAAAVSGNENGEGAEVIECNESTRFHRMPALMGDASINQHEHIFTWRYPFLCTGQYIRIVVGPFFGGGYAANRHYPKTAVSPLSFRLPDGEPLDGCDNPSL